jgi:small conductance mechanosensitive channel
MDSLLQQLKDLTLSHALPLLGRACGALVLGLIGRKLILATRRRLHAALERRTLAGARAHSFEALLSGALHGLLLLAILRVLGVETASLVAMLATSGLVVGMSWSRLLSNAGAGVFLMMFQPFRTGDFISIGDVSGTVHEVGLFTTTIDTLDHQRLLVGNSQLYGDHNAMSSSAAPRSHVTVRVPLMYGTDVLSLVRELQERMNAVPGILNEPVSEVAISEFLPTGPVVHLTAWCAPRDMHVLRGQLHAAAYEVLYTTGYVPLGAEPPEDRLSARPLR